MPAEGCYRPRLRCARRAGRGHPDPWKSRGSLPGAGSWGLAVPPGPRAFPSDPDKSGPPIPLAPASLTPGVLPLWPCGRAPPGLGGAITSVDTGDRPSQEHGTLGSRTAQAGDRREGTWVTNGLSHKAPDLERLGGQLTDLCAAVWPLWGTAGAPHPKLQATCS